MKKLIVLTYGMGRIGSSYMMKVLRKSGAFVKDTKTEDKFNPGGYFESEPHINKIKKIYKKLFVCENPPPIESVIERGEENIKDYKKFLNNQYKNKDVVATKSYRTYDLPFLKELKDSGVDVRVIVLHRNIDNQAASSAKMNKLSPKHYKGRIEKWNGFRDKMVEHVSNQGIDCLNVNFEDVTSFPKEEWNTISKFLDMKIDIDSAAIITKRKPIVFTEMHSHECISKLVNDFEFKSVLDIGCGRHGNHKAAFKSCRKDVTSIDYVHGKHADIVGDYSDHEFDKKFDCIWCSHVLEHQLSPNEFLKKIHRDLTDDGVLAITVPPLKHEIVGGHVSLWNAGLLLMHLILAGFDCSLARVKKYGYNISVIVRKRPVDLSGLKFGNEDIQILKRYLPVGVTPHGFNGDIHEINWK